MPSSETTRGGAPAGERILVVEDEEILGKLFVATLGQRGYSVTVVDNVDRAVELLPTGFDLIITDKNLPGGKNGLDLMAVVKSTTTGVDVIMVTAYADTQSAVQAIRLGVYDYIVKPFDSLDDVLYRIERALEKRRMTVKHEQLLVKLRTANDELTIMNSELEVRVAERTQQLEQLTLMDDVTGLHNQRFLYQRLPEEIDRAQRYNHPLAVLMLDLDRFKEVNDTHDHLFGSRVLRRVGEELLAGVRSVDKVVRYGGDEFCVILPETELPGALAVAHRLRDRIEAADFGEAGESYRLTVSIGVAPLRETGANSAQEFLRVADRALYAAKEGGRNRVVVAERPSGAEPSETPAH